MPKSENNIVKTLLDDNGFEVLVNYDYEKSYPQQEEGHGKHEVGNGIYTKLNSVELVFAKKGIEILPLLTDKQKEFIISSIWSDEENFNY